MIYLTSWKNFAKEKRQQVTKFSAFFFFFFFGGEGMASLPSMLTYSYLDYIQPGVKEPIHIIILMKSIILFMFLHSLNHGLLLYNNTKIIWFEFHIILREFSSVLLQRELIDYWKKIQFFFSIYWERIFFLCKMSTLRTEKKKNYFTNRPIVFFMLSCSQAKKIKLVSPYE